MSSILGEIKPETAALIAARAKARGLSVDAYLKSVLNDERNQHAARVVGKGSHSIIDR